MKPAQQALTIPCQKEKKEALDTESTRRTQILSKLPRVTIIIKIIFRANCILVVPMVCNLYRTAAP